MSGTKIEKETVNLTLPLELLERLDLLVLAARHSINRDKRKQLRRSKFLELIISQIIDDHEQEEDQSLLTEIILGWADELE